MSNDPTFDRDEFIARYHREEEARQSRAKATAKYLAPALRFLGVARAACAFDGYADEGTFERPTYEPAAEPVLPPGLDARLRQIMLESVPRGWENNGGATGSVSIKSRTGRIAIDIEYGEEEDDPEGEVEEEAE